MNALASCVSQIAVVLACGALLVLAIDVIGAMRAGRMWGPFALWSGVAVCALLIGARWRDMPLEVAGLLFALAWLLWGSRRRLTHAAARGGVW